MIHLNKYKEAHNELFDMLTIPEELMSEKALIFKYVDTLEEACEKAANYDSLRTPKKVQVEETMTFNDVPLPTLYQLRVTCSCGEVFYCDGVQYWKTIPDKNGEFKKDGKLKMEYRFCPHCGQKMKL